MTPKQTALDAINALPDDAMWDAVTDAVNRAEPRFSLEQIAEWNRRIADYRSGKSPGIDGDTVRGKGEAMLASLTAPATVS